MGINERQATVHNIRFYKPEVQAIHCMCFNKLTQQLAVSRSDASVEIWNVKDNPYLQKVVPGQPNTSVEDLKWCAGRLISCGLQGTVVEYDLLNCTKRSSVGVTGSVAWCLDYSSMNNLVAVGTEDGFINVFTLTDDGLEFLKFLDKQQGRVLCICWETSGKFLVTGSVDVVRVWNLASGHAVHKMTTGRTQSLRETVVWSVAVTSDFTVISGDSRGFITFWDGNLGIQIETFRSHEADILTVALADDQMRVVCAGVDPVIAAYGRVSHCGGKRQWARGGLYRMHEHDVRAIALTDDGRVFSGGVSGYLVVTSTTSNIRQKCPPFLKGTCVQAVANLNQVLLRYIDRVELWALGTAISGGEESDTPLLLSAKPCCLVRINAKPGEFVLSAAISPNGRYIVYSTQTTLRFIIFNLHEKSMNKLPSPSECGSSALLVTYSDKTSQRCVAVTTDNKVFAFDLTDNGMDEIHNFQPSESSSLKDTISHVAVSSEGDLIALADCASHVAVWSTKSWTVVATLPTYTAVPTAMNFPNGAKTIFVSYSDNKVVEFDLNLQKYTEFGKTCGELFVRGVFNNAISGIVFDSRNKRAVLLHDDSILCSIIKPESQTDTPKKQRKRTTSTGSVNQQEIVFRAVKKFQHILSTCWLTRDEFVLVELTPLALTESLPPALMKKKFGT